MSRNLTGTSQFMPGYSRVQIRQQTADQLQASQGRAPNLEMPEFARGFTWN
jgi:hypothetical protein